MAGINIARLRQQNLFPEIPDMSGGTMDMTGINPPPYAPPDYDPGLEDSAPDYSPPQMQSEAIDPRQPVNPNIAPPPPVGGRPVAGPGSPGVDSMQRTIDAINQIYTPETTSRDRFNRLLDAAPERDRPSALSSFAAFGMGMGAKDPMDAINVHEAIQFAPHRRDMQDWTAKTGPFGNAAQFENTANANERNLASNVVTAQTAADRLAENARQADQKNEVAMERNRLTAVKNSLGRGWIFNGRGTTIIAQNTATGETKDTGISTGWMTEADKIAAENAGDLAVQESRNAGALAAQGSRNAGQLAVQTLRSKGITGNGSTKGLLPSQQKDALFNKAKEWVIRHPEDAANITLNPAQRDFEVKEPGESYLFGTKTGMDPARYDEFVDYLYGSGETVQPATPSGMPTPPAAPAMPQGGSPQIPGGPQGGNVPRTSDPRFQTPPGYDPHGKQPQAQRDAILRANPDLAAQGQPQTQAPPQPRGNINLSPQAQQPISAPPPQQSTSPTMWSDLVSKVTSPSTWQNDPNVQRQQRMQQIQQSLQQASSEVDELFNVKQGQPTNSALQQELDRLISSKQMEMNKLQDEYERLKSTGQTPYAPPTLGQSAPAPVGPPPQEYRPPMSIAEMEAENAQIDASRQPQQATPPAQQGIDPGLQQRAIQHLQKVGLPVTPANIAYAIKVGDVR